MADKDDDILEQFKAFMEQKAADDAANAEEDEEIELWNEKGQGGRVRRSRAPQFAEALGIEWLVKPDPEPTGDNKGDNSGDNAGKSTGKKSTGRTSTNTGAAGVAKRYFAPKGPVK